MTRNDLAEMIRNWCRLLKLLNPSMPALILAGTSVWASGLASVWQTLLPGCQWLDHAASPLTPNTRIRVEWSGLVFLLPHHFVMRRRLSGNCSGPEGPLPHHKGAAGGDRTHWHRDVMPDSPPAKVVTLPTTPPIPESNLE